jgi:hypothetical protein
MAGPKAAIRAVRTTIFTEVFIEYLLEKYMVVTCKFAALTRGGYRRLTQTIAGALLHA